jgi:hypothetical protein
LAAAFFAFDFLALPRVTVPVFRGSKAEPGDFRFETVFAPVGPPFDDRGVVLPARDFAVVARPALEPRPVCLEVPVFFLLVATPTSLSPEHPRTDRPGPPTSSAEGRRWLATPAAEASRDTRTKGPPGARAGQNGARWY